MSTIRRLRRSETSLVNMYLQPNDCESEFDCYRLPTLVATLDELRSLLDRMPWFAQVHFTVTLPRRPGHNQYPTPALRTEFNKMQIETARQEVTAFNQELDRLERLAAQDPTKRRMRDELMAHHGVRMDMLASMVGLSDAIVFGNVTAEEMREVESHLFYDPPPPYTP